MGRHAIVGDPRSVRAAEAVVGASKYVPVTKGSTNLPNGVCRALLVGTAGTANLTEPDGTDRDNVPLQQGYNPIYALKVRSGGTATDIWALY